MDKDLEISIKLLEAFDESRKDEKRVEDLIKVVSFFGAKVAKEIRKLQDEIKIHWAKRKQLDELNDSLKSELDAHVDSRTRAWERVGELEKELEDLKSKAAETPFPFIEGVDAQKEIVPAKTSETAPHEIGESESAPIQEPAPEIVKGRMESGLLLIEGDQYRCLGGSYFEVGETVTLIKDDGTDCPRWSSADKEKFLYDHVENFEKLTKESSDGADT